MKLYATTTSERASKGQGGNWLDISIYDEEKNKLVDIHVDTFRGITIYESDKNYFNIGVERKAKGKRQKGENWDCKICKRHHDPLIDCTDYHV